MLLSVIIPVYNVEKYLKQCLESIYSQILDGCEVILVNDGSTDASLSVLEEYTSSFSECTTLINKVNGGLSSARNAGLAKATGEYVYFVDSDDYLAPDSIATILSVINSHRSDALYIDCVITDSGKRLVRFPISCETGDFRLIFDKLYHRSITILPNAFSYIFSRNFLISSGLHYTEGLTHEDALFKYQLYLSSGDITVVHIEKPFYVYRVGREGSISTKKKIKNFTDLQFIRKEVDRMLIEKDVSDLCFYNSLFQGYVNWMLEASKCGLMNELLPFWDREDRRIMKKGILNLYDYRLWLLACLNPVWMVRYMNDSLPSFARRLFNVSTSLISPYH